MISAGNATITVSDLDAAIRFYTGQLGFKLTNRFGDRWATINAGPSYWTTDDEVNAGLVIGLRPSAALGTSTASLQYPPPGTTGGVGFGLETYEAIEDVAKTLKERGVRVADDIVTFEAGKVVSFVDLDGLATYAMEFSEEMLEGVDLESESGDADDNALLSGGHAIVYVSDMDAAVRFYADTLGLKLTFRFENKFATVLAGRSLVIALHPQTPHTPIPGTRGSVTLGLVVDEPIDKVISRLAQQGVRTLATPKPSGESGTGRSESNRFVDIEDPDGNVITLWEANALAANGELAGSGLSARR